MKIHQLIRTACCITISACFIIITYFSYQYINAYKSKIVQSTLSMHNNTTLTVPYQAVMIELMAAGFSLEEIYHYLYTAPQIVEVAKKISEDKK